jgi:hypothetical protein
MTDDFEAPAPAPAAPPTHDRPITFREFARTLTEPGDIIWLKYLQHRHGKFAKHREHWQDALEALKKE